MTGVIEQIVTLFCVNNKTQDPSIMFTWASVSYCYTDLCRLFCWILLSMLTKHRSQLLSRFVCQTMWMDTCKLCTPVIRQLSDLYWIITPIRIPGFLPVFRFLFGCLHFFGGTLIDTNILPLGDLLYCCLDFYCDATNLFVVPSETYILAAIKQWVVSLLVIVDLKCSLVSWWSTCYRCY